ncbi:MAG: tetratricopeptide repeat protein [Candidatus Kapabacteria bacterium]|nr:tetratricopeptide repeat protein [Candidatus Kapabacteria bacterium]
MCLSADYSKAIQDRLELNDYDKALQIASTQKNKATHKKDTIELIKATNSQGLIFKQMEQHDMARMYFYEAVRLSKQCKFDKGEYAGFMNLGNSYELVGKYDPAIECINNAYTVAHKIDDSLAMARAKMALGNIYFSINDFERADQHFVESYILSIGDTVFVVKLFINTALNAIEMQRYQRAQNLLQTALEQCYLVKDRIDIKLAQGELYYKNNEVKLADAKFNEAIEISKTVKDAHREAFGYYGLGRLISTSNFQLSENHLKTAYRAFQSLDRIIDMVKVNNALFELYIHHKKYTLAGSVMENMGLLVIRPANLEPGMTNLLNQTVDHHQTKIELEASLAESKLENTRNLFIGSVIILTLIFIAILVFVHFRRKWNDTLNDASKACESRRLIKKDLEHYNNKMNLVKSKAIEINAYADIKTVQHLPRIKENSVEIIRILDTNGEIAS